MSMLFPFVFQVACLAFGRRLQTPLAEDAPFAFETKPGLRHSLVETSEPHRILLLSLAQASTRFLGNAAAAYQALERRLRFTRGRGQPQAGPNGYLSVDATHRIYWAEFGNPRGEPALFLHGGPGAGCNPGHARFFDARFYRIILFDQRGCGKSEPYGELINNDTPNLVNDLEKLREHLKVSAWHVVLGGSWGTTLALAYAQKYPDAVNALVLRGVCCMRSHEIDWLFGDEGGSRHLQPEAWKRFADHVKYDPLQGLKNVFDPRPDEGRKILMAYYDKLLSDAPSDAEREWSSWENSMFSHRDKQDQRGLFVWNGSAWSERDLSDNFVNPLSEQEVWQRMGVEQSATRKPKCWPKEWNQSRSLVTRSKGRVSAQYLLTCHYSVHNAFMDDDELFKGVQAIRNIPCIAVQGAADCVTPPATALELHRAWPEMELRLVRNSGHSMYDTDIAAQLTAATNRFKDANESEQFWVVAGGGAKVREGMDLDSEQLGNLAAGSLVEKLELVGVRLHYSLFEGSGPQEGWITVQLDNGAKLAEPAYVSKKYSDVKAR